MHFLRLALKTFHWLRCISISLFCHPGSAVHCQVATHPRTLWVRATILLLTSLWLRNLGSASGYGLSRLPVESAGGPHVDGAAVQRPRGRASGASPWAFTSPHGLSSLSLSLHVASLDFCRWWLGKKKEKGEAKGLLSSGIHFFHTHLTKGAIKATPDSRGRETDPTSRWKMLKVLRL